jgi:predicted membrane-bound mannosyltransferase
LVGLAAAAAVSIFLFTSFFQNPAGWPDSILSYKVYFVRAGEAGFHLQPWPYYLRLLAYSKPGSGPVWSEALLLILALAGTAAAFRPNSGLRAGRPFLVFLFFYTLLSTAAYSLIPYKTPWNALPFYLGFVLLAGHGAASLLGVFRNKGARFFVLLVLTVGFGHLGAQAWRAGHFYPADPRNPYVYAQTSPDFLKLVLRVEGLAAVHPDHDKMLIKVIAGPYETWPLPWYLRRFERVGYWQTAAEAGPPGDAAVIISDTAQAEILEPRLEASFQSEFYELRPNVFLVLYVRADLWEKYLSSRSGK